MCGGRLVDDDAHRALGRMGAHVDQAARETLVLHAGRSRSASARRGSRAPRRSRRLFAALCVSFAWGKITPIAAAWETKLVKTAPLRSRACQWYVRAASIRASPCLQPFAVLIYCRSWPRQACSLGSIVRRNCGRCLAVGRRCAVGGAAYCRAGPQRIRRPHVPRRRRDQAQGRLEDLLAVSWRLRRAAGAGFLQVAKRQSRHRALSGADAVSRRRRRQFDRLQGRRDPAAACRAAGCAASR